MEKDRGWLTIKEVSEYLSISHQTLMLWTRTKRIPAMKVGKSWRYKKDEIDQWVREGNGNPSNQEG